MIVSVLTGLGGSYLIVWQNLKRMGKEAEATKFLLVGGLIAVGILIISRFVSIRTSGGFVIGILFPVWHLSKHIQKWQKENPGRAKFTWGLVGWGVLGLILTIAIIFPLALLFPQP